MKNWKVEGNCVVDDAGLIAQVFSDDAQLIANAPRLAEALQDLLDAQVEPTSARHFGVWQDATRNAREVLNDI